MFTVFTSLDLVVLLFLSIVFIGCDTRLGFLALWALYFLLGWWIKGWSVVDSVTWVTGHIFDVMMYAVIYLAIGGAWLVFKWWLYVHKSASELKEAIAEYNAIPDESLDYGGHTKIKKLSWLRWSKNNFGLVIDVPKVADNKSKIVDWIAFWWFSIIQTFFGDLMHQIFTAVYRMFYNMYDHIAKSVWGGIDYRVDAPVEVEESSKDPTTGKRARATILE